MMPSTIMVHATRRELAPIPRADDGRPWTIRAAQIDLARQKETLPTVLSFITFLRQWHYNALVLYLEGAIRTPSFPYRDASVSYDADEIRQIVAAAGDAGLEVIPAFNLLGHAEHFLQQPELEHLAETDGWGGHMFCPTDPQVHRFLETYLDEVLPLFPGRHVHIGCDETWSIGCCPRCRQVLGARNPVELVVDHIVRYRDFLAQRGKRTWIWDDMLEFGDDALLARVPRDVVLCCWHYIADRMDHDGFQGHFSSFYKRDWLSLYRELGFDVVVCPKAAMITGTQRITEVSRPQGVVGGLQTLWAMGSFFLPAVLPGVALSGLWWNRPELSADQAMDLTLERLLPQADSLTRQAVRSALVEPLWLRHQGPQYYLRGELSISEVRHMEMLRLLEPMVARGLAQQSPGQGRDILEQIHTLIREQIVAGRLRRLLPRWVHPRVTVGSEEETEAVAILSEMKALREARHGQWQRYRGSLPPTRPGDDAHSPLDRAIAQLQDFLKAHRQIPAADRRLLQVRLRLQDAYGLPLLRIDLAGEQGGWCTVFDGTFKPVELDESLYVLQVPLPAQVAEPRRLRFTVRGFGGQGVSFASIVEGRRTLVPLAVEAVSGPVHDASAMLVDNSLVAHLGSMDVHKAFVERRGDETSVVEVSLGEAPAEQ